MSLLLAESVKLRSIPFDDTRVRLGNERRRKLGFPVNLTKLTVTTSSESRYAKMKAGRTIKDALKGLSANK